MQFTFVILTNICRYPTISLQACFAMYTEPEFSGFIVLRLFFSRLYRDFFLFVNAKFNFLCVSSELL